MLNWLRTKGWAFLVALDSLPVWLGVLYLLSPVLTLFLLWLTIWIWGKDVPTAVLAVIGAVVVALGGAMATVFVQACHIKEQKHREEQEKENRKRAMRVMVASELRHHMESMESVVGEGSTVADMWRFCVYAPEMIPTDVRVQYLRDMPEETSEVCMAVTGAYHHSLRVLAQAKRVARDEGGRSKPPRKHAERRLSEWLAENPCETTRCRYKAVLEACREAIPHVQGALGTLREGSRKSAGEDGA